MTCTAGAAKLLLIVPLNVSVESDGVITVACGVTLVICTPPLTFRAISDARYTGALISWLPLLTLIAAVPAPALKFNTPPPVPGAIVKPLVLCDRFSVLIVGLALFSSTVVATDEPAGPLSDRIATSARPGTPLMPGERCSESESVQFRCVPHATGSAPVAVNVNADSGPVLTSVRLVGFSCNA